jgi:polyisoprenoid-binding protein YceI
MRLNPSLSAVVVLAFASLVAPAASAAPESYNVDPVHSSSAFRIMHANAAPFWGRFNEPIGSFILDEADPAKSSFTIELSAEKVDTANAKRDAHLKSPDFFNAKQYPRIRFVSKSVKPAAEGKNMLDVTGELTMHGVTKPITAQVELTGKGEFPPGTKRAGVEATMTVKMSDFEIKAMPGALSDEVKVIVALEGVKAK